MAGVAPGASVRFLPREDGVGHVRMADATGKNEMTADFVEELCAALREAAAWPDLRALVLIGHDEVFSSGASVGMLRALAGGGVAPTDILLAKAVLDVPVPVIAAMAGHAVGGGFALGLAADMPLIARESRYGATFMNMGFTPGMGMIRLLEHVVSPAMAHELLYTGEARRGAAFEGRSGFSAILPRAEVLPYADTLARRVAEKPRRALSLLKRTLTLPRRCAFEETHTLESLMHEVTFAAPETLTRIEATHDE